MNLQSLTFAPRPTLLDLLNDVEGQLGELTLDRFPDAELSPPPGRYRDRVIYLRDDATEEVFAHEVLHANLESIGFRSLAVEIDFDETDHLSVGRMKAMEQLINLLSNCLFHMLMFPKFVELGYTPKQFVALGDPSSLKKRLRDALRKDVRRFRDDVVLAQWLVRDFELKQNHAVCSDPTAIEQVFGESKYGVQFRYRASELQRRVTTDAISTPPGLIDTMRDCLVILRSDAVPKLIIRFLNWPPLPEE